MWQVSRRWQKVSHFTIIKLLLRFPNMTYKRTPMKNHPAFISEPIIGSTICCGLCLVEVLHSRRTRGTPEILCIFLPLSMNRAFPISVDLIRENLRLVLEFRKSGFKLLLDSNLWEWEILHGLRRLFASFNCLANELKLIGKR